MAEPTTRSDGVPGSPAAAAARPALRRSSGAGRARHRAAHPPQHRRPRPGLLWPLAALAVVGLVAARTLRGIPLPGDGALMAPAFLLSRGDGTLAPFSPAGLGAAHAAVYATLTRAVERHATLAAAERELLLVVLLVSAVLLWRTARRLGAPDAACAVGVLALGTIPPLARLHAVPTPGAFAAAWLLAAALLLVGRVAGGWAPGGRPPAVIGLLAGVLAVLLAPDVLLLVVAAAAATATLAARTAVRRAALAGGGVLLLAGVRVLLERWAPDASTPGSWGADRTGLVVIGAAFLAVGLLTGWLLPALRPLGVALVAATLLAVLPPSSRVAALVVTLPLAALLLGALAAEAADRLARPVLVRRPRARLAAGVVGVVVLAGLGAAATAELAGTRRGDLGAAANAELVGWTADQLPDDAVLLAAPRVAAELLHAGADQTQVLPRSGGAGEVPVEAASTGGDGLVLEVTAGPASAGSAVRTRLGEPADGPVLTVADPRPVRPSQEQLAARRDLAEALLANPTTAVSAADAEVLASGGVDPRLLLLLAGIGAQYGVGLESLPRAAGEPAEAPVRQAVIASVGGTPLRDDPAAADRLRAWLAAQQPPYSPTTVRDVPGGLLVGYTLVRDPDALVASAGGR